MKQRFLKAAIVLAGLRNQDVAVLSNQRLPVHQHISELDISKILTGRKVPTAQQRIAIALSLNADVRSLFISSAEN